MSTIHHPHVPGFWVHLQRGMNRLFADMEVGVPWTRHNYAFEDTRASTNCINHGKAFAEFIVPELARKNPENPGLIPGTNLSTEDVIVAAMHEDVSQAATHLLPFGLSIDGRFRVGSLG